MRIGRAGERGVSTVELALMLPVVLVLLLGSLDLARVMNAELVVSSASREGARYATLHPSAAPAAIVDAVLARSVPLDRERVVVSASYDEGAGALPWPETGLPASGATARRIAVTVDVAYPWRAATFFGGSILGRSGVRLGSTSTMEAWW